jgi:hypothetical protein
MAHYTSWQFGEAMTFESREKITYEVYEKDLQKMLSRKGRRNRYYRFILFVLCTILMFFWKYTIVLGILVSSLTIFSLIMMKIVQSKSWILKWSSDISRKMIMMHSPIQYSFDEYSVKARTDQMKIEASWELIASCEENEKYIKFNIYGMIPIYFSKVELEQDNAMEYLKSRIKHFNRK